MWRLFGRSVRGNVECMMIIAAADGIRRTAESLYLPFFEVVQRMTVNYPVKKKIVCLAQSFFFHHVGLIYLLQNPNIKRFVFKYPFV